MLVTVCFIHINIQMALSTEPYKTLNWFWLVKLSGKLSERRTWQGDHQCMGAGVMVPGEDIGRRIQPPPGVKVCKMSKSILSSSTDFNLCV